MKVYAAGQLVGPGGLCTPDEAMSYVFSLTGVSTAIIGCRTPEEVEVNVRAVRQFQPLSDERMRTLEERARRRAAEFASYKRAV